MNHQQTLDLHQSSPLTEARRLQLLQVHGQLQGRSLTLTAAAGQSRGQPGGGGPQEWILQRHKDYSRELQPVKHATRLSEPAELLPVRVFLLSAPPSAESG